MENPHEAYVPGFQHKLPSPFPELLLAWLQNNFFLNFSRNSVFSAVRELLWDWGKTKPCPFTGSFLSPAFSTPEALRGLAGPPLLRGSGCTPHQGGGQGAWHGWTAEGCVTHWAMRLDWIRELTAVKKIGRKDQVPLKPGPGRIPEGAIFWCSFHGRWSLDFSDARQWLGTVDFWGCETCGEGGNVYQVWQLQRRWRRNLGDGQGRTRERTCLLSSSRQRKAPCPASRREEHAPE